MPGFRVSVKNRRLAHSMLLFSSPLDGKCLLQPPFFARFEEKRMLLGLSYDVLLLYFSLKAPQGTLQGLAFVYYYYRQFKNLLNPYQTGTEKRWKSNGFGSLLSRQAPN